MQSKSGLTRVQASVAKATGRKRSSILNRLGGGDFQSSTKIEALREEVHAMLQNDPSAKAIVFSQFTSMLDLIAFRLQQVCAQLPLSAGYDSIAALHTHATSVLACFCICCCHQQLSASSMFAGCTAGSLL